MPLYHDPPGKDEPDITLGMEIYSPGQDPKGQMTPEGREHDYRLSDDEYSAARQIAHNTGQPVHVMDVQAEAASMPWASYGKTEPDHYYSGHMTEAEQTRYGDDIARGMSPSEADYGVFLDRGRETLAAEIREQEHNRQLQTGMAEREGGQ